MLSNIDNIKDDIANICFNNLGVCFNIINNNNNIGIILNNVHSPIDKFIPVVIYLFGKPIF